MISQLLSIEWFKQVCANIYALICCLFTTTLGYFLPIKNTIHIVLFFFLIDVVFGYWSARKLKHERFSVKIIWNHTIPRMTLSIFLILGTYMWDKTFNQEFVSTSNVIGWFIAGLLLYSIAENGGAITNWSVFGKIKNSLSDKIQGETGIKLKND